MNNTLRALVFSYRSFNSKTGTQLVELLGWNIDAGRFFSTIMNKKLFDEMQVIKLLYGGKFTDDQQIPNSESLVFELETDGLSNKIIGCSVGEKFRIIGESEIED